VPPPFPLLLFVPAIAIDLLLQRSDDMVVPEFTAAQKARRDWQIAATGAVAFVVIFGVVQWHWSEFLLSEGSRNYFFQGHSWGYTRAPGLWETEYWIGGRFVGGEPSAANFLPRAWWALPVAFISARTGLACGNWMSRVRR